jgi:hypothetical protein
MAVPLEDHPGAASLQSPLSVATNPHHTVNCQPHSTSRANLLLWIPAVKWHCLTTCW